MTMIVSFLMPVDNDYLLGILIRRSSFRKLAHIFLQASYDCPIKDGTYIAEPLLFQLA